MNDFSLSIIKTPSLRSTIADTLRRGIILGELVPGQRLDEQTLADKLGVSRVPIREALAILEHDGLVQKNPRQGSFVIGLTDDDIHDIYQFRHMIEDFAIQRVAATIDEEGLARLASIVERTEAAVRNNQPEQMAESDLAFHREIVNLAGNKRTLVAWESIAGLVAVFLSINSSMYRTIPAPHDPIDAYRHSKILRLIKSHNADEAAAQMREHLLSSEMVMRESIKRIQSEKQMRPASDSSTAVSDGADGLGDTP